MPNLFGVEVSQDVYEANRHLAEKKEAKTQARQELEAEMRKQFALQFEAMWRLLGGPELEREFRFCPDRKWRSDYYCEVEALDSTGSIVLRKVLIELDGGVWTGGRHVRPKGYIEDCFKMNQAALLGFFVIRIGTGMVTPNYLQQIIDGLKG